MERSADLLRLSPAAGCGCKIPFGELSGFMAGVDEIMASFNTGGSVRLDATARDDAALYEVSPGILLAISVDFGTPVSSDASTWGRIATLNALSDVYAMGARPVAALSVLGWPGNVSKSTALALTRSAVATLAEASAVLVGGHTIVSDTPLFGLAVTGIARPGEVMLLGDARPGQVLLLTKPLGTGVVIAASKAGVAEAEDLSSAEGVMSLSNRTASELAVAAGVRAATDVTGYGLMGHLHNLLRASGHAAVLDATRVPVLAAAERLIEEHGIVPNNAERTYFELDGSIDWGATPLAVRLVLCDPQTSGGLLLSADPTVTGPFLAACAERGQFAAAIGEVTAGRPGEICVRP